MPDRDFQIAPEPACIFAVSQPSSKTKARFGRGFKKGGLFHEGEGIYHAMTCARFAANAVEQTLATGGVYFSRCVRIEDMLCGDIGLTLPMTVKPRPFEATTATSCS